MLKHRALKVGDLIGVTYVLENIGDELPTHSHEEFDNHITIVAFGSIEVLGFGEPIRIDAAAGGRILDWDVGQPHGFRALTPGATVVNVIKKYMLPEISAKYNPPLQGQLYQPLKSA
jgi:hypothetical protein